MFRPHIFNPETGAFRPILDGVKAGRFYQTLKKAQREAGEQYTDSWDRFFNRVKDRYHTGEDITDQCGRMCDIMMTRDEKMRELVKKHFEPADYFEVRDHMVGTGMIGGKACGMLLARAIIRNEEPEVDEVLERAGYEIKHKEGYQNANWILLDYGDLVIHLFDTQNRLFYDLDRIWRDGKAVSIEELEEGKKGNVD
jgi:hypothetical protein